MLQFTHFTCAQAVKENANIVFLYKRSKVLGIIWRTIYTKKKTIPVTRGSSENPRKNANAPLQESNLRTSEYSSMLFYWAIGGSQAGQALKLVRFMY